MRSISRFIFIGSLISLSHTVLGQRKINGTFINVETDSFGSRTEEIIIIQKDSIWFERIKYNNAILPGEAFTKWAGEIRHNTTDINNVPFYSGWLMVMSCDTCPEFWKYTLKSGDSLNVKTHVWVYGETDTIIKHGDTTYMTPTEVSVDDPTDLDRVRELLFKFTPSGDIRMDNKLYRRKKKKR
jgi:hypothetical protein